MLPNGAPTLIDTEGTIICTLTDAEQAYSLSDGLAKVTSATSDTVRYVDKAGKTELTLTGFTWAGSFSEGLAPVVKDGKYGYIDKDGRVVIAPTYDTASDFTDGKAVVQLNDKYGVVDTEGRSVIAPQFDGMTPDGTRGYVVEVADRYGYCDPEGRLTVNPQFDWLSPAGDGELMLACQNELYGYVDREGQWVINPQYPSAQPFSQRQAIASAANGTMGLIDETGAWVVAPQFDRMLFPVADRPTGAFVVSDYFDVEGDCRRRPGFLRGRHSGRTAGQGLPAGPFHSSVRTGQHFYPRRTHPHADARRTRRGGRRFLRRSVGRLVGYRTAPRRAAPHRQLYRDVRPDGARHGQGPQRVRRRAKNIEVRHGHHRRGPALRTPRHGRIHDFYRQFRKHPRRNERDGRLRRVYLRITT